MSNTDTAPAEVACVAVPFAGVLSPRELPLGGLRAIRVRRTLPQRERSLTGAWCFADHYGRVALAVTPVVAAGRHAVSALFDGAIRESVPSSVS